MKIHHYDPNTREFLFSDDANPDPLEPGRYLVPASSTEVEPPEAKEGFRAAFVDDAWTVLRDARGLYYSTETGMPERVETLGELPAELTTEPRPSPLHIYRDGAWVVRPFTIPEQRLTLDAQLEEQLGAGVAFNGHTWHLDDRFMLELVGMILGLQLGVLSGPQRVRTVENQILELDASGLTTVAAACGARRREIYEACWAAKDAL